MTNHQDLGYRRGLHPAFPVPRPLLMIVGTEADMAQFVERFSGPKELHRIDGATHIDLDNREKLCRWRSPS